MHANAQWEGTSKDWYKLSDSELNRYIDNGCIDTKVTCPKGGMVLWDSRAIHGSTDAVKNRMKSGRFGYTCFVCMNPRRYITPKIAKRRRKAFIERRTTSHWPARSNLFSKTPCTHGNIDHCNESNSKRIES